MYWKELEKSELSNTLKEFWKTFFERCVEPQCYMEPQQP